MFSISAGILIPFFGTALGAFCVFFVKKELHPRLEKSLLGFAAGVMTAASIWSLLIPALEMASGSGRLAFIPSAVGITAGMLFLLLMDRLALHLPEGSSGSPARMTMLALAVTIHNIPEGMAVGVVYAGILSKEAAISQAAALALSAGIAIQNIPEGAIISLPAYASGNSKGKAFLMGVFSGLVEPVGAVVTIWLAHFVTPLLPYFLGFAAGAMLYVVTEELIPESARGEHSYMGTFGFALGFVVMLILDVAFG